ISHVGVTREREVVVVDVEDRPGVLADLTRKVANAGIDPDLVYVATRNRLMFGAADLGGVRAAARVGMREAVLGAGGIGGLIAAALARAGAEVVLLVRPETL